MGRVVPAHSVLPGGHPGAAGDHQPRPGPRPRQSTAAHHEPAAGKRGWPPADWLLLWPAPCLGQAQYRHVDGGVHVHRAQRQPPSRARPSVVVARERHCPTTAFVAYLSRRQRKLLRQHPMPMDLRRRNAPSWLSWIGSGARRSTVRTVDPAELGWRTRRTRSGQHPEALHQLNSDVPGTSQPFPKIRLKSGPGPRSLTPSRWR